MIDEDNKNKKKLLAWTMLGSNLRKLKEEEKSKVEGLK